ncbi:MAG: 50S ribosomal protein L11 methyltransferase [Rhodospirillales bacterium]|jgi:ribosomal protein L11 methyltransferase|nr:50S ribosomal protein L11 methyltransferase [Rhodospirillales bacterium]
MWLIRVVVPPAAVAAFETALAPFCDAVSALEAGADAWRVEGLARQPPDAVSLDVACRLAAAAAGVPPPVPATTRLVERDWVACVQSDMPAVTAGCFTVYGSHLDDRVARGRIGLRIDAAQAFGSGHHASTAGCLAALSGLRRQPVRRALDLGCGSGVLAIAIARLWRARVIAADIDPRATDEAAANAGRNGVGPWIRTVATDGIGRSVRAAGPFDLIVANILARPLVRLAGAIVPCLGDGGWLILSGFLDPTAAAVARAYAVRGLQLVQRRDEAGWTTLVYRRRRRPPRRPRRAVTPRAG